MGFLSPWFLAGLAAIGLPIYLHLLRRHKADPRPFSSLMFFERRTQSSIRHRRLRHLLLLSFRIAVLLLLALAFANPFINRPWASVGGNKLVLLVIDNSFSMRAGTRLADARRAALAVVNARKSRDPAQVMALGSRLEVLTRPTQQIVELRNAVESIQPGDSRSSFGELARGVRSLAASAHTPIELHLFSDFQKSDQPASFAEIALPSTVTLIPHSVVKNAVPNWTVESVNAPAQVWDPRRARVRAVVAGFHAPAAARTVSLVVNGKTVAVQRVSVPADGRATVEFQSLDVPYGVGRCEVRIDSADSLPGDDRYLFSVERSDPRQVLFVHESNDSRSQLYFSSALASAAEGAFSVENANVDRVSTVQPSQYAFVVLSDVLSLPAADEARLVNYVRGGGSVLIAAGTSAAQHPHIPVFAANILGSRYYSRDAERFLTVGEVDPSHPSIAKADGWSGVRFYFAVQPDTADARVVARLTDGTPLLWKRSWAKGGSCFSLPVWTISPMIFRYTRCLFLLWSRPPGILRAWGSGAEPAWSIPFSICAPIRTTRPAWRSSIPRGVVRFR